MTARHDDELAHHLVHVLARLDGLMPMAKRCCDACGCLLLRGESSCPHCALTAARPITDLATRRAV